MNRGKEIAVLTNAIAWGMYSEELHRSSGGDVIELSQDEITKCVVTAERAWEHLQVYYQNEEKKNNPNPSYPIDDL